MRSVSPIHCEYLTNMGVRASMSISIVVGGKLWGPFSCHHMSPKLIPYPVRMSFQIFSQVCSAIVERLEQGRIAELLRVSTERRLAPGSPRAGTPTTCSAHWPTRTMASPH
ncbi:GAF domain-containing protein [Pseudomonas aeruginosa]